MNDYYVKAKRIFTTDSVLSEHYMLVKSVIIDSFTKHIKPTSNIIDYSDHDLIPGLIDLHIHGRNGCDVIDAKMESMTTISSSLAEHGVTGFLATTVTTDWPQTIKAMETIGQAYQTGLPGAQLLGGYSEGLFFSEIHKVAHNDSYFMPLNKSLVDEMIPAANGALNL
jgi:N-acetylglucosamine-6-phosphate deacetylase/N-acetylgalactosamine-6-phosphate deacetylase